MLYEVITERKHAGDEGERGHDDRAEPEPGRIQSGRGRVDAPA